MVDTLSVRERSERMARIKGKGNKGTEIVLVQLFRKNKIKGWRRHYTISGRPDFVFRKQRLAIFVDGCFWHFCPSHGRYPASRRDFWRSKFAGNKARDLRVNRELRQSGWYVLRIWEHELKRPTAIVVKVKKLLKARRFNSRKNV